MSNKISCNHGYKAEDKNSYVNNDITKPSFVSILTEEDQRYAGVKPVKDSKKKHNKSKHNKEIEQIAKDEADAVVNSNDWHLFNEKKYPGFKEKFKKLLWDFQHSKIGRQYTPKERKSKWKWGSIKWFIDDCKETYNFPFYNNVIIYDPVTHIADYYNINHRKNNIFVFDDYMLKEWNEVKGRAIPKKWSLSGFQSANDGNILEDPTKKRSEHDKGVSPTDYILFIIKRFKRILEHYNNSDLELLMYQVFCAMWKAYEVNDFEISPKNIYDWCSGNLEGTKKVDFDKVDDLIRTFNYNEQFNRKNHHQKVYEDPNYPGARVLYNKRKEYKALCEAIITVINDESKPELNWENIGNEFIKTCHKTRQGKNIELLYKLVIIPENDWQYIDEETKKNIQIIEKSYEEGYWPTDEDKRLKRPKTGQGWYLKLSIPTETKITLTNIRYCLINVTRIKSLYDQMIKDNEFINGLYKAYGISDNEMNMVINCNIKQHKQQERSIWHNILKNNISLTYKSFIEQYPEYKDSVTEHAFKRIKTKLKKNI